MKDLGQQHCGMHQLLLMAVSSPEGKLHSRRLFLEYNKIKRQPKILMFDYNLSYISRMNF